MRPVDKGVDRGSFNPYSDAQRPLAELLGDYCSYCERWIPSGIHIEHKRPKNDYAGESTLWTNFLLSCANCNSGKGHGVLELAHFVWPDSENTLRAFRYDSEGRVIAEAGPDVEVSDMIHRTWRMLGLNRHPDASVAGMRLPTKKDMRWLHRRDAWKKAKYYLDALAVSGSQDRKQDVVAFAVERGMFSVWISVFYGDTDMRLRLIEAFPGTARDCFDGGASPVARPGRKL